MISLGQVKLADILPPNLRSDPTIAAAATAADAQRADILAAIYKLPFFSRLETLTDEEADELAYQFHVDFYDTDLPLQQKRALVANSYAWHRRKGTKSAVEELIRTVFGDGSVQEWFEYGGQPGTFRVITTNADTTNAKADQFIAALSTVTRASAHLDVIQIDVTDKMEVYIGHALHVGKTLTFKQVM